MYFFSCVACSCLRDPFVAHLDMPQGRWRSTEKRCCRHAWCQDSHEWWQDATAETHVTTTTTACMRCTHKRKSSRRGRRWWCGSNRMQMAPSDSSYHFSFLSFFLSEFPPPAIFQGWWGRRSALPPLTFACEGGRERDFWACSKCMHAWGQFGRRLSWGGEGGGASNPTLPKTSFSFPSRRPLFLRDWIFRAVDVNEEGRRESCSCLLDFEECIFLPPPPHMWESVCAFTPVKKTICVFDYSPI